MNNSDPVTISKEEFSCVTLYCAKTSGFFSLLSTRPENMATKDVQMYFPTNNAFLFSHSATVQYKRHVDILMIRNQSRF